jgi:hypothetical protein
MEHAIYKLLKLYALQVIEAKAASIFTQAIILLRINKQFIHNYYRMDKMEVIVMIMME